MRLDFAGQVIEGFGGGIIIESLLIVVIGIIAVVLAAITLGIKIAEKK